MMCKQILLLPLLVPQFLFAEDLELDASLSKEEIVQFEPVVLTISVSNKSAKPQDIYWAFDPYLEYLNIYVTNSAGETTHWRYGGGIPPNGFVTPRPLPAKQAVHHRILLAPYPHAWMDKPGKYHLHVTYQFSKAGLELGSKRVPITVKPAEGIDKEALERFRGHPQATFLRNGTTAPVVADEFEAVIQKYPKSVYVPWCYYVLGRAFQQREGDETAQARQAREQYGVLVKKFPKFPLKAEVEYQLARELFRVGKPDEAVREIEKLIKFDDKNPEAELYLFYQVRQIMGTSGDGNQPHVNYRELPPD